MCVCLVAKVVGALALVRKESVCAMELFACLSAAFYWLFKCGSVGW